MARHKVKKVRNARKKQRSRSHAANVPDPTVPRAFVVRSGEVGPSVQGLIGDLRKVMAPNSSQRLKERKYNALPDYGAVASQLMVSHCLMLRQTQAGPTLRIGRFPHGPTCTFSILEYTLMKEVLASQARPNVPIHAYEVAPLVVLNGFSKADPEAAALARAARAEETGIDLPETQPVEQDHLRLMATHLQNMFPALHIQKLKITDARRVVLITYNPDQETLSFRHYAITLKDTVGVSKGVRQLLGTGGGVGSARRGRAVEAVVPTGGDVTDFILQRAGGTESDVEEGPDGNVDVPLPKPSTFAERYQAKMRRMNIQSGRPMKSAKPAAKAAVGSDDEDAAEEGSDAESAAAASQATAASLAGTACGRRAIRLSEIGPRMTLQLHKIEDELCAGEVLYHRTIKKTRKEIEAWKQHTARIANERARRRAEQDAAVERKKKERAEAGRKANQNNPLWLKKYGTDAQKAAFKVEDADEPYTGWVAKDEPDAAMEEFV